LKLVMAVCQVEIGYAVCQKVINAFSASMLLRD
jgi:hypothetical protein